MAHNAFMVTTATNPFALAEDSAEMWAAYGITSWFRIDGYAPFFLVNTGVDMFTSIAIKGEDPVKVAEREAFRVPVNLVAIKGWEYLAPRIPVLGPYLSGEAASIGGVPLGLLGIYGMTGIGVAVQVNAYAQVIKGRYQELLWLTEEVDKARVKALGAPATLKDRYLALNGWYQAEKKMLEKYEEYGLSLGIANTLSLGWRSDLGYLTSTIEKEVRAWDEWRGTYSQTWRILDKAYGRIEQTS
jgi:hypothetical protein